MEDAGPEFKTESQEWRSMHEPITLDTEPSDLKKKITNAEK